MTTIKEIYANMDELLNDVEEEDVLEEVKDKYKPYSEIMNTLLETEDLDSYLQKYEEMHNEDNAVLKCYNLDSTEELKNYIEDNDVSFETLKTETVYASCEALKFVIYDSEEEDDY